MSRLQTQAIVLDRAAELEPPVRAPRAADVEHAPIGSPVHALHDQLQLFEAPLDDIEPSASARSDKAPGWVRLVLPVVLSMALWAVILRVTGLIN